LSAATPAALKPRARRDDTKEVTRPSPVRRILLLSVAVTCTAWSLGAPIAGRVLYPTPEQQPRGATKLLFYCHLG
jgi:hypothetical protein